MPKRSKKEHAVDMEQFMKPVEDMTDEELHAALEEGRRERVEAQRQEMIKERRRERRKAAGVTRRIPLPPGWGQSVYDWYGPQCAYCGMFLIPGMESLDHIVPLVSGKPESRDAANFIPACRVCNGHKARRSVEEFRHAILTMLNETLHDLSWLLRFIPALRDYQATGDDMRRAFMADDVSAVTFLLDREEYAAKIRAVTEEEARIKEKPPTGE